MEELQPKLTKPYKHASVLDISQSFHAAHQAIDWVKSYGTPLVAPERVKIQRIWGDGYITTDENAILVGYGLTMLGLETGYTHTYWHTLPYLPVWAGEVVERGKIVAYMGNSGYVLVGGKEVPARDRLLPHKPGTHLHSMVRDFGGNMLDPLPLTDLWVEPDYGRAEILSAMMKTLVKISKLAFRQ